MNLRMSLLGGIALLAPVPALAQDAAAPPVPASTAAGSASAASAQPIVDVDEEDGEETIVVTGARPRGSVVGDIPPENVGKRLLQGAERPDG